MIVIYFSRKLKVGKTVNNLEEIKDKLNKATPVFDYYVIIRAYNNLFEIYSTYEFLRSKKKDEIVIGISNGKKEAMNMVKDMVKDMYIKE